MTYQCETVHTRHLYIGNNQVRFICADRGQGLFAVTRLANLIGSELSLHQLPHRRFVDDEKDPQFLLDHAPVDEDLGLFHLDPGFLRQERHRQSFQPPVAPCANAPVQEYSPALARYY